MDIRKVAAYVGVHRHDIPRGEDQAVEVGEGRLDDVVEEVDLDLRRNGVERLAFDRLRDRLQANPLTLVGNVLDDLFALARTAVYGVSAVNTAQINDSTHPVMRLLWPLRS